METETTNTTLQVQKNERGRWVVTGMNEKELELYGTTTAWRTRKGAEHQLGLIAENRRIDAELSDWFNSMPRGAKLQWDIFAGMMEYQEQSIIEQINQTADYVAGQAHEAKRELDRGYTPNALGVLQGSAPKLDRLCGELGQVRRIRANFRLLEGRLRGN